MPDPIGDFLNKFKNLTKPDETVRRSVVKVVKNKIGFDLGIDDVSVKRGTVFLNTHGAVKERISMKKEEILDLLKEDLGFQAPKDII